VGGVVNVLEAIKHTSSVKAALFVTTDKCYDNQNWIWGYRENDALGGKDPYSASKAMAEIAVKSYRDSFFQNGPFLATARAGNVIGGGDFAENRLIPDTMKALSQGKKVLVRNPSSIRPWLFVLDVLYGYLLLAQNLFQGKMTGAWNFGPKETAGVTAKTIVEHAIDVWGEGSYQTNQEKAQNLEMHILKLNWDKAKMELGWSPKYRIDQTIEKTVGWYKNALKKEMSIADFCRMNISDYCETDR